MNINNTAINKIIREVGVEDYDVLSVREIHPAQLSEYKSRDSLTKFLEDIMWQKKNRNALYIKGPVHVGFSRYLDCLSDRTFENMISMTMLDTIITSNDEKLFFNEAERNKKRDEHFIGIKKVFRGKLKVCCVNTVDHLGDNYSINFNRHSDANTHLQLAINPGVVIYEIYKLDASAEMYFAQQNNLEKCLGELHLPVKRLPSINSEPLALPRYELKDRKSKAKIAIRQNISTFSGDCVASDFNVTFELIEPLNTVTLEKAFIERAKTLKTSYPRLVKDDRALSPMTKKIEFSTFHQYLGHYISTTLELARQSYRDAVSNRIETSKGD